MDASVGRTVIPFRARAQLLDSIAPWFVYWRCFEQVEWDGSRVIEMNLGVGRCLIPHASPAFSKHSGIFLQQTTLVTSMQARSVFVCVSGRRQAFEMELEKRCQCGDGSWHASRPLS